MLLESTDSFRVMKQVGNGRELLEQLDHSKDMENAPHIVLLDVNMPLLNGYETMKMLQEHYSYLPVLVLTMYEANFTILNMIRLGARGFLAKNCKKDVFVDALEHMRDGDFYIPKEFSKMLMTSSFNKVPGLSDREIEFLGYCHLDLSYREIGERMFVSERTVHGYRDSLFLKLNRKSRNGLVAYAFNTGIVTT